MKYRIAMWAGVGFLVACAWALYAAATAPMTMTSTRLVWDLVRVTCPVSIAGLRFPISLYWALVANAATYALVGLLVESLLPRLNHAK